MMSTVVSSDRAQHYLIDVRLDSLDRILMDSGVSRSERFEIVQSIEEQIAEMLDVQDEELSRESVLQILRSLDPPEAYCGDGMLPHLVERSRLDASRESHSTDEHRPQHARPSKHSGFAITSFVLALISIPTLIVAPIGTTLGIVSLIFGLIALSSIKASGGQLQGRWMALTSCCVFAFHLCTILLLGLVILFQ